MIIIILYFIQITHTDDFPSTGTRLVHNYKQEMQRNLMRIRAAETVVIVRYNSIIPLFLYKYRVPKSTFYIMLNNYII